MKNSNKTAFTLIELVICLAIITILLSVVKVNIQSKDRTIAMEELNMIHETLNSIKNYSISKKEKVILKFDTRSNSLEVSSKKIKFKNLKILENKIIVFNSNGIAKKGDSIPLLVIDKKFYITVRPATSFIDIKETNE